MNQEVHAMKGKVASKVVDYAVEAEKQKLKKKAKKRAGADQKGRDSGSTEGPLP